MDKLTPQNIDVFNGGLSTLARHFQISFEECQFIFWSELETENKLKIDKPKLSLKKKKRHRRL
jgi:predicted nuclease of restriction endonuclease-like RecB superfamily